MMEKIMEMENTDILATRSMDYTKNGTALFGLKFPAVIKNYRNGMFQGKKWGHVVDFSANFHEYHQFLASGEAAKVTGKNDEMFREHVYRGGHGGDSFKGGSFKDFADTHSDFKVYHESIKKISASKTWKNMVHSFDMTSTRKRVRSAYDGDYDHDKRYDIEPFTRREVRPTVARIVKLRVDCSYNCQVDANEINEFGGFVAAIINMIERNGFLVELVVSDSSYSFFEVGDGNAREVMVARFLVKKADQYLPISQILKAMSSVWYRRAGFSSIIAAAEFCGETVAETLGRPYDYGKCWEKVGDQICIYSAPGPEEQNKILEKLMDIIGERK